MQRVVKPKNARSKRALQQREPKYEENPKQAIFAKTSTCSQPVKTALAELHGLKKPHGVSFNKSSSNKDIHPFENASTLEFWSQKNDAAFVLLGSHSKKRPHNLTMARMFNHQMLDMLEIGVEKAISMADFKTTKPSVGQKPLFQFSGDLFDTHPLYIQFKSMIVDLFHGEVADNINLTGLEHVISVSTGHASAGSSSSSSGKKSKKGKGADGDDAPAPQSIVAPEASTSANGLDGASMPVIHFRVYRIGMLKSDSKTPYVKLELCGPAFDFSLRRHVDPSPEVWKSATRTPTSKTAKRKIAADGDAEPGEQAKKKPKNKNIDIDEMGDKVGRLHMAQQDLSTLQARKMKGLKGAKKAEKEAAQDADQVLAGEISDAVSGPDSD